MIENVADATPSGMVTVVVPPVAPLTRTCAASNVIVTSKAPTVLPVRVTRPVVFVAAPRLTSSPITVAPITSRMMSPFVGGRPPDVEFRARNAGCEAPRRCAGSQAAQALGVGAGSPGLDLDPAGLWAGLKGEPWRASVDGGQQQGAGGDEIAAASHGLGRCRDGKSAVNPGVGAGHPRRGSARSIKTRVGRGRGGEAITVVQQQTPEGEGLRVGLEFPCPGDDVQAVVGGASQRVQRQFHRQVGHTHSFPPRIAAFAAPRPHPPARRVTVEHRAALGPNQAMRLEIGGTVACWIRSPGRWPGAGAESQPARTRRAPACRPSSNAPGIDPRPPGIFCLVYVYHNEIIILKSVIFVSFILNKIYCFATISTQSTD